MKLDVSSSRTHTIVALACLLFANVAQAQQSPPSAPATPGQQSVPTAQSLHALIAAGFKIVATTLGPPDETYKQGAFLVTLQGDRAVAVCTFSYTNWENIGTSPTMDNAKLCDVRAF